MNRHELLHFLRAQPWAVEASVNGRGEPQAAVIGVAVTDRLELVFDTLATSRKAANLRANPRVALVLGWDEGQTAQRSKAWPMNPSAWSCRRPRTLTSGASLMDLSERPYPTSPTFESCRAGSATTISGRHRRPSSCSRVNYLKRRARRLRRRRSTASRPTSPARDLVETEKIYAGLGFGKTFGDEGWLVLKRGALELEFFPHPALVPESSWFSACVRVDDVDSLVDAWRAASLPSAGIPRLVPPSNADSGLRDAALVDCNGSLLRILGTHK